MKSSKIKKLCLLALFTSLAIIFSYVEFLLPKISYIAPGIKMGFANIAIILVLYLFGAKEAFTVSVIRTVIMALLFTSPTVFIYSVIGAIVSLSIMTLLKAVKCSKLFVSIIGGISHNISQILIFYIISKTELIFSYMPILTVSGLLAGLGIGLISTILLKIIENSKIIKK